MIAVFSIPVFTMTTSADLPGMFLTHGLGFLIIIIALMQPPCLKKVRLYSLKNPREQTLKVSQNAVFEKFKNKKHFYSITPWPIYKLVKKEPESAS